MKTVVTMTSWKKRISMVGEFIYIFMQSQTMKPDIFYLWLSMDEFPHQFAELPKNLLAVAKTCGVIIKFCPGNDYVFKRWNVYPTHYNDLVISVDEDQFYDVDLIKDAVQCTYLSNTSYNIFSEITVDFMYSKPGLRYDKVLASSGQPSIKTNCNGNHIFPPRTFPIECMHPDNLTLRRQYCKRCDESYMLPWIKYINGKTTYINKKSKLGLLYEDENTSMHNNLAQTYMGERLRDIQLYFVLRKWPKLMDVWRDVFPDMNTAQWDKIPDDQIMAILS
jgi:hypothetical protein